VELVAYGGARRCSDIKEDSGGTVSLSIPRRISRLLRPTTGDRVRLADTELIIEIEKDFTH